MRKFAVVRHSEDEITLSMVRWGWLKRLTLFLGKKLGKINRYYIALFIPKYEIAVYEGRSKGSVSSKLAFYQKPLYIFYYPDAVIASKKWDELASILEGKGIFGAVDFIGAGDPTEQGHVSFLNIGELIARFCESGEVRSRAGGATARW